MHPAKVRREHVRQLSDLPNIGPALAHRLMLIGISSPEKLIGQCPYALFEDLCRRTQTREDPCVIDTFISVIRFMAGEEARPWWAYTAERQQTVARMPHGGVRDILPLDPSRIPA